MLLMLKKGEWEKKNEEKIMLRKKALKDTMKIMIIVK